MWLVLSKSNWDFILDTALVWVVNIFYYRFSLSKSSQNFLMQMWYDLLALYSKKISKREKTS